MRRRVPIQQASHFRYVIGLTWKETAIALGKVRGIKFQAESVRRAVESARKSRQGH